ncbi:MAG: App1 family protein [Longimicrobiales bacterium]
MERKDGAVEAWAHALGRLTGEVEQRLGGAATALKRRFSGDRPLAVLPYRGYGTRERVYVTGRVVEDPGLSRARPTDRWYRNLVAMYRRIQSAEVAGARVRIRLAGADVDAVTDAEGYYRAWVEPREPILADRAWHEASVELRAPRRAGHDSGAARQPVLVPPRTARFGVISDMDDTVVRSNTTEIARMLRDVMFGNAHTRLPFDGVAAFYQALWEGVGGHRGPTRNPIFYVSSSPWNLYDVLIHFLEIHRIPVGPLELRDWGFSLSGKSSGSLPTAHREHKRLAIDRILTLYPDLPFILIGDSGQQDPEIYHEVVHDHPERILACYIRNVSGHPERADAIDALAAEVRRAGSSLVLADDTADAAEHAAEHGWIHPLEAEEVVVEAAHDEAEAEAHGEKQPAPTVVVDGDGQR